MTDQQWAAMLAVHCTAPFKLIQAATPHMRDAAKQEMESQGAAQPRCVRACVHACMHACAWITQVPRHA